MDDDVDTCGRTIANQNLSELWVVIFRMNELAIEAHSSNCENWQVWEDLRKYLYRITAVRNEKNA